MGTVLQLTEPDPPALERERYTNYDIHFLQMLPKPWRLPYLNISVLVTYFFIYPLLIN